MSDSVRKSATNQQFSQYLPWQKFPVEPAEFMPRAELQIEASLVDLTIALLSFAWKIATQHS
jgi:hypothetical protein